MRFNTSEINRVMHNGQEIAAFRHKGEIMYMNMASQLRSAGAVMAILAENARGFRVAPLEPRGVPNGVVNLPYSQRISNDVVLPATGMGVDYSGVQEGVTRITLTQSSLPGIVNSGTSDNEATKLHSSISVPRNNMSGLLPAGIHYFSSTVGWVITVPGVLTQAEARKKYGGKIVVRYQLAVPIDVLDTPALPQFVDYVGKLGKNLFDLTIPNSGSTRANLVISNDELIVVSTSNGVYNNVKFTLSNLTPGVELTIKLESITKTGVNGGGIDVKNSANTIITSLSTSILSRKIMVPNDGVVVLFCMATGATSEMTNASFKKLMVSYEDVPYEPYGYNNVLPQGFGWTAGSGIEMAPFVSENGTDVAYTNNTQNGDFVNGLTGWVLGTGAVTSVSGGVATFTALGTSSYELSRPSITTVVGKRYYISANVKSDNVAEGVVCVSPSTTKRHSGNSKFERLSFIFTATGTLTDVRHLDSTRSGDITASPVQVKECMNVCLDDHPLILEKEKELGRPLTAKECDRLLPFVASNGTSKVKVMPIIKPDGGDDKGILGQSLKNIAGGEDFALCWGGVTPDILLNDFLFANCLGSPLTWGIGIFMQSNGSIRPFIGSVTPNNSPADSFLPNELIDLRLERKSGVLTVDVYRANGSKTQVLNFPSTNPITWQPHSRLFCRSSSADGVTTVGISKTSLAWFVMATGPNVSKLDDVLNRLARDYRRVV